jgi:hypothetical protein
MVLWGCWSFHCRLESIMGGVPMKRAALFMPGKAALGAIGCTRDRGGPV